MVMREKDRQQSEKDGENVMQKEPTIPSGHCH